MSKADERGEFNVGEAFGFHSVNIEVVPWSRTDGGAGDDRFRSVEIDGKGPQLEALGTGRVHDKG